MAYKKTNEAWFGDSFNRDGTITAYNCAISSLSGEPLDSLATVTADCAIGSDYTVASVKGDIGWNNTIAISSSVDTLVDRLEVLQTQLDDLKKNFVPKKGAHELRSALKTLKYKREIE